MTVKNPKSQVVSPAAAEEEAEEEGDIIPGLIT